MLLLPQHDPLQPPSRSLTRDKRSLSLKYTLAVAHPRDAHNGPVGNQFIKKARQANVTFDCVKKLSFSDHIHTGRNCARPLLEAHTIHRHCRLTKRIRAKQNLRQMCVGQPRPCGTASVEVKRSAVRYVHLMPPPPQLARPTRKYCADRSKTVNRHNYLIHYLPSRKTRSFCPWPRTQQCPQIRFARSPLRPSTPVYANNVLSM